MAENNNIIFHETQKFNQVWLWFAVLFIAGLLWYGVIKQLVFNIPFGSKPKSDAVLLILWIILGIALPAFFYSLKLITKVRSDGLYIRFFPLHFSFRRIPLDELKRYEVRTYRPIWEYGGWGIRWGLKGKAYNVSGNRGVQLEFLNRKRLLIGSQKPEELVNAIDLVLRKRDKNKH